MPRLYKNVPDSGHLILVVDDDAHVLQSSSRVLESEGHRVLTAPDGATALEIHRRERPHLLLLDYFMPRMTGEEVVRRIRMVDPHVQIILTTAYSGERPARTMMRELDIQGYHDKGEGADRLLLWVDAALKAYRQVRAMERQRAGLEYIVHFAPDVHRLQRVDELLPGLLWQLQDLLEGGVRMSREAHEPVGKLAGVDSSASGFVALSVQPLKDPRAALAIRAGQGRFFPGLLTDSLEERERYAAAEAIATGRILLLDGATVVPLRIGPRVLGVVYLEVRPEEEPDLKLLEIFAAQAGCAVQSALVYGEDPILYEMATRDPATGLLIHGHWNQLAHQLLKSSLRGGLPVSMVRVSVEGLDAVRGPGQRARALRALGELVQSVVADHGWTTCADGDDLLILLPDEGAELAETVAHDLLREGSPLVVPLDAGVAELRLRAGTATVGPEVRGMPDRLLDPADAEEVLAGLIQRAGQGAAGMARAGSLR